MLLTSSYVQIQTKFSPYKEGKDPKLYPYDVTADIPTRVKQSIESSLGNLAIDFIDCLVLHSMCPTVNETIETWREMENYVPSMIGALGMSNTDLATLRTICEVARVKPMNVQNRLTEDNVTHEPNPAMPPGIPYPEDSYDQAVRQFCYEKDITYTPWGILWGNPLLLERTEAVTTMSQKVGTSKELILFGGLQSLPSGKLSILCGTKRIERMRYTIEGLNKIYDFILLSEQNRVAWEEYIKVIWSILESRSE